jgi:tetratricopeptide (TPR) repeat protein
MIVKNEADRILDCLRSAKPYIDYWTIIDTGSTDKTRTLIEDELASIPGSMFQHPWINFGHNRSIAFKAAKNTADWLLALDADMRVSIDVDFEPDSAPAIDAYMIQMGDEKLSNRLPLFLKGNLDWQSIGAVHEYTMLPSGSYKSEVTDAIQITHSPAVDAPEKYQWYLKLLQDDFKNDPDNPRTLFYLAQTHLMLGNLKQAKIFYDKRRSMAGWDEETFYAAYMYATLQQKWIDKQATLTIAWEFRPTRLEPLYDLAHGYNELGQYATAHQLSSVPISYCFDTLLVHRAVWNWGIIFERSIAAQRLGLLDEALTLNDGLLAYPNLPDHIREAVIRNRTFCYA